MKPLSQEALHLAIAQARFGVNRTEGLTALTHETLRARKAELRMANMLVEIEMYADGNLVVFDLSLLRTLLNDFYGQEK